MTFRRFFQLSKLVTQCAQLTTQCTRNSGIRVFKCNLKNPLNEKSQIIFSFELNVSLAAEDPLNSKSPRNITLGYLDVFFTTIFTIEIVVKVHQVRISTFLNRYFPLMNLNFTCHFFNCKLNLVLYDIF